MGPGGEILEQGAPCELRVRGTHLASLLASLGETAQASDGGGVGGGDSDEPSTIVKSTSDSAAAVASEEKEAEKDKLGAKRGNSNNNNIISKEGDTSTPATTTSQGGEASHAKGSLVRVEERAAGAPALGVYTAYVSAAGGISAAAMVVAATVSVTAFQYLVNLSMARWIEAMELGRETQESEGLVYYLAATGLWMAALYIAISMRQVFFSFS